MRTEQEFLTDVLQRLAHSGVEYMLTGSMASNYWGTPRTTHDLDFVILLKSEQIDSFVASFEQGLFIQRESVSSVFQPPYQFNVLDEQSALKADFWQLRQNDFEIVMFNQRVQVELFGEPAWIATAEDVLLHKLYWNSLNSSDRQLLDAAGVFAVQAGHLDMNYLRLWGKRLGVADKVDDLEAGRLRPKST